VGIGIPLLPDPVLRRAWTVAKHLPARRVQPDTQSARSHTSARAACLVKRYGYGAAITGFVVFITLRKVGSRRTAAERPAAGLRACERVHRRDVPQGKSGWCSSICPLLPVQRIYGQTPFALIGNSHCHHAWVAPRTATTSIPVSPTSPT